MTSNKLPITQKAWIVVRRGHPSTALEFKSDWPVPSQIPEGHVLVKVQAGALNPVGYKLMELLSDSLDGRPHVAEYDLCGTVVDSNGTQFTVGDVVFGLIFPTQGQKTGQGALAQYVTVSATCLTLLPRNIAATDGAGLAVVGLTALRAFKDARLERGQTVLINGGSSGVGTMAIQVAKAKGCRVVATASGMNEEFVKSLGADEFIDYTAQPLAQYLVSNAPTQKFHAIIDAVGLKDLSLYTHSPSYLDPNGRFVTTSAFPYEGTGVAVKSKYVNVKFDTGEDLEELREMLTDGTVKPVVDSVWSFDDHGVKSAYERVMSGRAKGKVVVEV